MHVRISYMSNNEEKVFYDSNLEGVIDKASKDSAKTYFQYAKILVAKLKNYDMWKEMDLYDIVFDGSEVKKVGSFNVITKKEDKAHVFDSNSVKAKNPSSRRKKGKKRN